MSAVVHKNGAELDRGGFIGRAPVANRRSPVETTKSERRFCNATNGDFFIARGETELDASLPPAIAKNRIWYVSAVTKESRLVHISSDLNRIIKSERERLDGALRPCFYRIIGIQDKNAISENPCHKKYDSTAAADHEIACLLKLLDSVTDSVLDLCARNENLDKNSSMQIESILKLFVIDSVTYLLNVSEGRDDTLAFSGMPAKHVRSIINAIQLNYMDPELSPKKVARKLSITVRYVHALLHQSGKSFTERVQELRLAAAYRMLNSAQFSTKNIGEIAYQVGFSDQSHFNRCFKKRFGASPREVRRQARGKFGRPLSPDKSYTRAIENPFLVAPKQ
jgi:AraC-like DNA-binding protein